MLTDDFGCSISLDSLGAAIPGRYQAIRVQLKNGVVNDGFHEMSKPALGLQQAVLLLAPFRHVPSNFGETNEFPIPIANGIDHRQGPKSRSVAAYSPALTFETAFLRGGPQGSTWKLNLLIFGCEEE